MTIEQYHSLFAEIKNILHDERIDIVYCKMAMKLGENCEGYYQPDRPNKIFIGEHFKEKDSDTINDEPLVIAHELGHYFDFKANPSQSISEYDREISANTYMINISKKYGLEKRAESAAKNRMKDITIR